MNATKAFDWKRDYRGNLDWLPGSTILLTLHGSHAYGLATETSDMDIKGIAIPPPDYFLGFLKRFDQAESKNPDLTVYDIRKFFQLAADCNPNIIEILWTDENDLIHCDQFGRHVRHFRDHFLSKKARHTFSGYAVAQLKRIKTHRKWLLNPVEKKPERKDFDLPESSLLSADEMGAMEAIESREAVEWRKRFVDAGFSDNVMAAYQKERSYRNALREWQQYQNWKANRNPARAELEAKFGFDAKHAMHLVRLMRMCREILAEGRVVVKRPDRDELLAIRNGAWDYDKIVGWAEEQDAEFAELAEKSPLRHSPDRVYLDGLLQCIVKDFFKVSERLEWGSDGKEKTAPDKEA